MSLYNPSSEPNCRDALRLETVQVCVGFDDFLDISLERNSAHVDTAIIVTSHDDKATHSVARKHGAICVKTDLFKKNGRHFNKGAAINAGFGYFQYHGWRAVLDADIALPDNFRRLLFNHTELDENCIYGADRVDVIGDETKTLKKKKQHVGSCFLSADHDRPTNHRYLDMLHGFVPIGYFQLWNAKMQKPYPYSLGTAAHDDVLFATTWAQQHRRLLPSAFVYHLCARTPRLSENWEGKRAQPRLDGKAL